jgi:hypothetical protein
MPRLPHWTALRAEQNESWVSALLLDGDKVARVLLLGLFRPEFSQRMQFASDKNYEHAHRCYDQALQMNPDSVPNYFTSCLLLPALKVAASGCCLDSQGARAVRRLDIRRCHSSEFCLIESHPLLAFPVFEPADSVF